MSWEHAVQAYLRTWATESAKRRRASPCDSRRMDISVRAVV